MLRARTVRRLQRVPSGMQRRRGFTLLELMIAVTIMGTMAALMAPGVGEFLADARASAVAEDLIRLSRHVRARAQETGLAHMLVFRGDAYASGGLGQILVWEGMNNHCRQTPWAQTTGGTTANGHTTVDAIDLASGAYNPVGSGVSPTSGDTNRQVIVLGAREGQTALTTAVICYEPSGVTLKGLTDSSSAGFGFTVPSLPTTFTVTRTVNSEPRGAVREVVFPAGGTARFRY
jgi:prepilin-type N-terminal cleavage/methylation domain-containing protein